MAKPAPAPSQAALEIAERLVEKLFRAYERACEADGEDGCAHTPDGDPLICWHCRQRHWELVARRPIAVAIDAAVEAERAACEAVAQAAAEHFGKTQQGYRVDAVIYVRERIAARRGK